MRSVDSSIMRPRKGLLHINSTNSDSIRDACEGEPPKKRTRVQPDVLLDLQLLDDETNKRHIAQMQRMSTRHGNKAEILQLMKETFANRRK